VRAMAAVAPAEAFHMFDLTGAGVVLIDNLPKALGYAGVTVDLDTMGEALGENVHPSNGITLEQFEALHSQLLASDKPNPDAELRESFALLANGAATLPYADFLHTLSSIGEVVEKGRLEMLLKENGIAAGSAISVEQFVKVLNS